MVSSYTSKRARLYKCYLSFKWVSEERRSARGLLSNSDDPHTFSTVVLKNISKSFQRKHELSLTRTKDERRPVLSNVTLEVETGEIVCILGKNGSGKTTLIRILSTLIRPDGGNASISGFDIRREGGEVRKRIGVVLNAGDSGFQARLSGPANLEYYAALYHIRLKNAREIIRDLLKQLDLEDRDSDQYQSYSTGMRRRLGLARALLANPPVMLLDEPTLGVDPWSTKQVHEILKKLSHQGKSILCTTNSLSEAETIGDKIFTLKDGALVSPDPSGGEGP